MRHLREENELKKKEDIAMKHINWELNMLRILENILENPSKYSQ